MATTNPWAKDTRTRETRGTPPRVSRVFCYISSFVFRRNNRLPAVWARDSLAFRISTSMGRVAVRSAIVDRSVLFRTMCYNLFKAVYWMKCVTFYLDLKSRYYVRKHKASMKERVWNLQRLSLERMFSFIVAINTMSQWVGTCNSHTMPMSGYFYRLIYF